MHIPSHVLKPEIAAASAAISIPLLAYAFAKVRTSPELREKLPLLGAASVALLGLQAINVAIPGGSSAHLLGGAMLAIAFGPWLGMLGMACVFLLQASLFGDGGIDALGANWLNGAVVPALLGWAICRPATGSSASALRMSALGLLAGISSLFAGAALCAVELSLSGQGGLGTIAGKMVEGSVAWSLLEGVATALVVFAIHAKQLRVVSLKTGCATLIAVASLAFVCSGPFSSDRPDVLEKTLASSAASGR